MLMQGDVQHAARGDDHGEQLARGPAGEPGMDADGGVGAGAEQGRGDARQLAAGRGFAIGTRQNGPVERLVDEQQRGDDRQPEQRPGGRRQGVRRAGDEDGQAEADLQLPRAHLPDDGVVRRLLHPRPLNRGRR
jgi:hypothetical protein